MQKLILCLLFISSACISFAQNRGFNYQTVIRDQQGSVMANQSLNLEFLINRKDSNGTSTPVYQGRQTLTTNQFGLINTVIGDSAFGVSAPFSDINWAEGEHLLEINLNGSLVSRTNLESVPYAKVATAMSLQHLQDVDAAFPIVNQVLSWDGVKWVAGNMAVYVAGSGIEVSGDTIVNTAPDVPITLTGDGATTITGTYPDFTISSVDSVNDADADPTNEWQTLSLLGDTLSLSGNNSQIILPSKDLWKLDGSSVYRDSGFVGVGTPTPMEGLHVDSTNNVLFGKTAHGNGSRFFFHGDSIALRMGRLVNEPNNWDPDSLGVASVAFGEDVKAIGATSFVGGGRYNHAYGLRSAIIGGFGNTTRELYSFVGGGRLDSALGAYTFIGGGVLNKVTQPFSFIGGGSQHRVFGLASAITGGAGNQISSSHAFIGAGTNNIAEGMQSFIGAGDENRTLANMAAAIGGRKDTASGEAAFVGGGSFNNAEGSGSFVGGGASNKALGYRSFVGGGTDNQATGGLAFVAGGQNNESTGTGAFIGGGLDNETGSTNSFVLGGENNKVSAENSGIIGGENNVLTASTAKASFIAGGRGNQSLSTQSAVIGGINNNISQSGAIRSFIGGGSSNDASSISNFIGGGSNNTTSGQLASIIGGTNNTATEYGSVVAGGFGNDATGYTAAIVGGSNCTANGGFIGGASLSEALGSGAFVGGGSLNKAIGNESFVGGGIGNEAKSLAEAVFGHYPSLYTPASTSTFNSNDRLFVIGNGTSTFNRKNALTILKNGRVGINVSNPGSLFSISNNSTTTSNTSLGVSQNRNIPSFSYAVSLSNTNNSGNPFTMDVDAFSSSRSSSGIQSYARTDGGSTNLARGIISIAQNNNGNGATYGINSSFFNGSSTGPKYAAYFSGSVYSTGFYLPSDLSLKSNVRPAHSTLDQIMDLEVNTYQYKRDAFPYMNLPEGERTGFIAQNVARIMPELVRSTSQPGYEDGAVYDETIGKPKEVNFTAVDYAGMVPYLVKAMQEQQEIIHQQEKEIRELKTQQTALSQVQQQLAQLQQELNSLKNGK